MMSLKRQPGVDNNEYVYLILKSMRTLARYQAITVLHIDYYNTPILQNIAH